MSKAVLVVSPGIDIFGRMATHFNVLMVPPGVDVSFYVNSILNSDCSGNYILHFTVSSIVAAVDLNALVGMTLSQVRHQFEFSCYIVAGQELRLGNTLSNCPNADAEVCMVLNLDYPFEVQLNNQRSDALIGFMQADLRTAHAIQDDGCTRDEDGRAYKRMRK